MSLFLSMIPIYKHCFFVFFVFNCGFALTPKANITIPLKTNTEVLRLNLLYGESHNNVYGLNLGLFNFIRNDLIGVQIGIVNETENAAGLQIGLLNNSDPTYGVLKVGFLNTNFFLDRGMPRPNPFYEDQEIKNQNVKGLAISIGAANVMSGRFNLGLFNWAEGLNIGLINMNEGSSFNLGIVNIGTSLEVSPKEKRAISLGIFNSGSDKEEFQIGIINYCPNNTIPIMLVANYCSSPSPQPEQKTETQPESTK
ncbi:LA_2272/LA_2273 family lipoprotein [Leptospira kirschneri]|uniref:PPE family protein n=1 Tax=Leptospira kirschneri str. H1 TaxID=1049966 RepID=A0A0E2B0P6_9LEPT|nr:hypothetical protein [Leptospira kirschneri]EKO14809.1 hypothetical protein LEP1GSC081_1781 [Leptospira kirschneri str. H1]UML79908.1 hypothetical protein FH602_16720 [Leptospira kirschneri]